MELNELPKIFENIDQDEMLELIFKHSLLGLCRSSIIIHENKGIVYPFVIEAVYEYLIRFHKNNDVHVTAKLFGDICTTIFKAPKAILDANGLENLMTLFYLWQIEDQTYIFSRLYRYHWIFSYQSEIVDMKSEFKRKFGSDYIAFEVFCSVVIIIYLAIRDSKDNQQREYLYKFKDKFFNIYKNIINKLSLKKEEYKKYSRIVCQDESLLTFSLKISKLYPFIQIGKMHYCPMPHTFIPACSTSLLFRLTENNDKLYAKICKEVLEEYCYNLFLNQNCYSKVSREIRFGKNKLSSDVLVVDGSKLYCIEVKAFTPNTKTRLGQPKNLDMQINEVVEDLYQIYSFLYLRFPENEPDISSYDLNNRFGILALREDASFNRKKLYTRLFSKIEEIRQTKLSEEEKNSIISKIKITSLDEIENAVFTNTNISTLIDYYNKPGNEFYYTAQSLFNKVRDYSKLTEYEKQIDDLSIKLMDFINHTI